MKLKLKPKADLKPRMKLKLKAKVKPIIMKVIFEGNPKRYRVEIADLGKARQEAMDKLRKESGNSSARAHVGYENIPAPSEETMERWEMSKNINRRGMKIRPKKESKSDDTPKATKRIKLAGKMRVVEIEKEEVIDDDDMFAADVEL